ncbi:MAG: hypothetical protein JNK95_06835 [Candidatus Competibacter sp.]|nr:hypothetical protein [Candidatus Competibacter sp.]MDG4606108.1 hypothetical protein [Candidatus Contendobacter sp.]HRD49630.1 hypothetical protein [Candidatus Contendobacter sp.]
MSRATVVQITLTIALVVFIGLGLTAFLNYFKFERSFSLLIGSRFDAVLRDMKNTIETSLALGLPLNALRNTQPLIERETQQDPLILSIEVFEADGNVVFATDRDLIGDQMTDEWIEAWHTHDTAGAWRLREEDALVIGISLINNLDLEVGGIAFRFSRDFHDSSLEAMLLELGGAVAILLAATIVLALLGALLLLRTTRSSFTAMTDALNALSQHPDLPLPVNRGSDPALTAIVAAFSEIEHTAKEIRCLDEEG